MSQQVLKMLVRAGKSSDVVLAGVMAAIVGAMILPLPSWALDVGLALNLAAAVTLLVTAAYAKDALKVASFPTLLLLTTLCRLALNVSSTRLALSEGHAGDIIQAFGEFVVRGDYVVGVVVFLILALVQFIVVAKGAERVAEVSARFTLDAMPGKQMSIDADLRSGAINQAEACRRRRILERESQMFGAMDGAMKFVKGDVIAGMVIVAINLVGGVAVGCLQNGMTLADAASTYALLAIGDGLVSQLPSLCVSVAAGLVVTRVASEHEDASLGAEIGAQFFGNPKALGVVATLCTVLGVLPGMPHLIFFALAALIAAGAFFLARRTSAHAEQVPTGGAAAATATQPSDVSGAGVSPIILDLSPALTDLATSDDARFVKTELNEVRERLFAELGVRAPGIRVRTHVGGMSEGGYCIRIDEVPSAAGALRGATLYAAASTKEIAQLGLEGSPAKHPVTGDELCAVPETARPTLEAAGISACTASKVISDHLVFVLKRHASELLGVQEVQTLLDGLEPTAPALVKEAVAKVPMALLTDVLRKLVQEDVSIRNLRVILEALVAPSTEGDASALAERCRQALQRYLSHKYAPSGPLYAFLADPAVEQTLRDQGTGVDPERITAILEGVKKVALHGKAVVLASPDVRRRLRKLVEGSFPDVAVLTYAELNPELQIRPLGRLAPVQARAH